MFIKVPFNNGLHETKLIFRFSQVYNKDPPYWFFYAKVSGIIIFIYITILLLELVRI
jgi:hypothetical protein